jgi:hypothetical protein
MNIIPLNDNNSLSPFDSIRKVDENGNEYWTGRELMLLLGYSQWRRFADAIDRAVLSQKNAGNSVSKDFLPEVTKTLGRPQEDYKLSRYACYLVAMNGDPRKPEIAAAQAYFVAKTREAETIIPVQSDRIRELELELEVVKAKRKLVDAETAQMQFRHTVTATCSEPVQQKILGYQTVERVEYRDRIFDRNGMLKDGGTINKTELCHRYKMFTRTGKPDYGKLNQYLATISEEAFDNVPSIRENRELKREYLGLLDREVLGGNRQLFLGE